MDLIPAIDLLDGVAVRLVQGDYGRRAATLVDPARVVVEWIHAGVRWLHIVDLGGARAGRPLELEAAGSLAATVHETAPEARVELGGGLRRIEDVDAALSAGIDMAILGTGAVEDARLLSESCSRWPGRVAVGIDVDGEELAVDGWTRRATFDAATLAERAVEAGAAHLIVTDVRRDGTRRGPNRELLATMRRAVPGARLVAAGGIGRADDLRELAAMGVDGAVVGLALLDGSLSITDALAAAAQAADEASPGAASPVA